MSATTASRGKFNTDIARIAGHLYLNIACVIFGALRMALKYIPGPHTSIIILGLNEPRCSMFLSISVHTASTDFFVNVVRYSSDACFETLAGMP
jgi:hypothetical protein